MLGSLFDNFKNLFASRPANTEEEANTANTAASATFVFSGGKVEEEVLNGGKVEEEAFNNIFGEKAPDKGYVEEAPSGIEASGQNPVSSPDSASDPAPASRAQTPALDLDPDQPLALVIPKAKSPVLNAAPTLPDPNLNNTIIGPIINLVDSIFEQDAEDLKKYFFSIFIPPENDNKEKSIASTTSPDPILTSEQQGELKETLQKCANAYISGGDTDLTPFGPSDPQSGSTKITSTSSSTSKAQPPVYFGVGIKTELEDGDEKFLKITEIFSNSNLRKENQGNVDYTNQFITHLNCKLGDDTEAREYSITAIFKSFEKTNNQKEKFDEKIDQIFRDLKESSIKFKISKNTSQTDQAGKPAETAEVNVNKIIFEKTNGVYQQKKMTPPTITEIRDATNAETKAEGQVV